MTQQEKDRLIDLKYKISENTACLEEYKEYERILILNNIPKEQLIDILRQNGLHSWEQYLSKRNKKDNPFEQKRVLDGEIAGRLIGVGAGLLFWNKISELS